MSSLPAFKAMGSGHDTTPVIPTHIAGDFMLLMTESADNDVPTPSGWNKIGSWLNPVTPTCLGLYWLVATSSSMTNPSISSAGNHSYGVVGLWTGVNAISPIHSISPHFTPNHTGITDGPGLTTNLNNCLILVIFARHLDDAGALSSGETSPSLDDQGGGVRCVERFDAGTTTANGGGLIVIEGNLSLKGTIQPTSITLSSGVATACAALALQPSGESYGIKSQIVNRGDTAMPIQTKLSTAQKVNVWMADSADGKTGKTGLTLTVTIQKYGAAYGAAAASVTERSNGTYEVALTTGDMDTTGLASVRATGTAADPAECMNMIEVQALDKTDGVRNGMTALPNAAAEASGGLYTRGTGAGQINQVANGMIDANDVRLLGTAYPTPNIAGVPLTDQKYSLGTILATPAVAGIPKTEASGGSIASVSGAVGSVTGAVGSVTGAVGSVTGAVGSVTGAVGSVTGNVGGNVTGSAGSVVGAVGSVAAGGISASSIADGAIDRAAFAQDARDLFGEVRRSTAQAGTTTNITLDSGASAVDDFYKNGVIYIYGGLGVGQFRSITAYNGTSKEATVATWGTTPDVTSTFIIFAAGTASSGVAASGLTAAETADAVWGAVRATYATVGTFGEGVAAVKGAVTSIAAGGIDAGVHTAAAIAEAATGVWAKVLEGSHTAGDLMRGMIGAFVGTVTDYTTGTLVFRSLNAAKIRWTITTNATGRQSVLPGDLT